MSELDKLGDNEIGKSEGSGYYTIPEIRQQLTETLKEINFTPRPPIGSVYSIYNIRSASDYFNGQFYAAIRKLLEEDSMSDESVHESPKQRESTLVIEYPKSLIKEALDGLLVTATTPVTEDTHPRTADKIRNYERVGITPEVIGKMCEKLFNEPLIDE